MRHAAPVHIALAANHRYVEGLKATLVSMVNACSDKNRLKFHVFSDGLTDGDKTELVALAKRFGYEIPIDFRKPDMKPIVERFSDYYGTHTTFIRIFFPETLPDLDWVLWADVDTLWFKDPIGLWNERDSAFSVLWSEDLPSSKRFVRDWHLMADPEFDSRHYCCAGVMLMNLDKLRKDRFVERSLELVGRLGTPPFADQGCFNALCCEDAKIVDDTWDLVKPNVNVKSGVVLHFNGLGKLFNDTAYKGWRPLYEIWFRYREQVLNNRTKAHVWPSGKRALFAVFGRLYPFWWLTCLLPIRFWQRDNIRRTLFFAWLRKKALWPMSQ